MNQLSNQAENQIADETAIESGKRMTQAEMKRLAKEQSKLNENSTDNQSE